MNINSRCKQFVAIQRQQHLMDSINIIFSLINKKQPEIPQLKLNNKKQPEVPQLKLNNKNSNHNADTILSLKYDELIFILCEKKILRKSINHILKSKYLDISEEEILQRADYYLKKLINQNITTKSTQIILIQYIFSQWFKILNVHDIFNDCMSVLNLNISQNWKTNSLKINQDSRILHVKCKEKSSTSQQIKGVIENCNQSITSNQQITITPNHQLLIPSTRDILTNLNSLKLQMQECQAEMNMAKNNQQKIFIKNKQYMNKKRQYQKLKQIYRKRILQNEKRKSRKLLNNDKFQKFSIISKQTIALQNQAQQTHNDKANKAIALQNKTQQTHKDKTNKSKQKLSEVIIKSQKIENQFISRQTSMSIIMQQKQHQSMIKPEQNTKDNYQKQINSQSIKQSNVQYQVNQTQKQPHLLNNNQEIDIQQKFNFNQENNQKNISTLINDQLQQNKTKFKPNHPSKPLIQSVMKIQNKNITNNQITLPQTSLEFKNQDYDIIIKLIKDILQNNRKNQRISQLTKVVQPSKTPFIHLQNTKYCLNQQHDQAIIRQQSFIHKSSSIYQGENKRMKKNKLLFSQKQQLFQKYIKRVFNFYILQQKKQQKAIISCVNSLTNQLNLNKLSNQAITLINKSNPLKRQSIQLVDQSRIIQSQNQSVFKNLKAGTKKRLNSLSSSINLQQVYLSLQSYAKFIKAFQLSSGKVTFNQIVKLFKQKSQNKKFITYNQFLQLFQPIFRLQCEKIAIQFTSTLFDGYLRNEILNWKKINRVLRIKPNQLISINHNQKIDKSLILSSYKFTPTCHSGKLSQEIKQRIDLSRKPFLKMPCMKTEQSQTFDKSASTSKKYSYDSNSRNYSFSQPRTILQKKIEQIKRLKQQDKLKYQHDLQLYKRQRYNQQQYLKNEVRKKSQQKQSSYSKRFMQNKKLNKKKEYFEQIKNIKTYDQSSNLLKHTYDQSSNLLKHTFQKKRLNTYNLNEMQLSTKKKNLTNLDYQEDGLKPKNRLLNMQNQLVDVYQNKSLQISKSINSMFLTQQDEFELGKNTKHKNSKEIKQLQKLIGIISSDESQESQHQSQESQHQIQLSINYKTPVLKLMNNHQGFKLKTSTNKQTQDELLNKLLAKKYPINEFTIEQQLLRIKVQSNKLNDKNISQYTGQSKSFFTSERQKWNRYSLHY